MEWSGVTPAGNSPRMRISNSRTPGAVAGAGKASGMRAAASAWVTPSLASSFNAARIDPNSPSFSDLPSDGRMLTPCKDGMPRANHTVAAIRVRPKKAPRRPPPRAPRAPGSSAPKLPPPVALTAPTTNAEATYSDKPKTIGIVRFIGSGRMNITPPNAAQPKPASNSGARPIACTKSSVMRVTEFSPSPSPLAAISPNTHSKAPNVKALSESSSYPMCLLFFALLIFFSSGHAVHFVPVRNRHEHFAGLGALVFTNDAFFFHHLQQAGAAGIAHAQRSLQQTG